MMLRFSFCADYWYTKPTQPSAKQLSSSLCPYVRVAVCLSVKKTEELLIQN